MRRRHQAPGTATAPAPPGAEQAQHVRGSVLLVVGRLSSLLFTVATQVVLVRALTLTEYGAFAYALAITSACRLLLSLGQGQSLSRFVTIFEEQRDYGRLLGSVLLAVATILGTTAVLVAVTVTAGDQLLGGVGDDEPQAGTVLLVLICLAPLEALDQVVISLFAAFSKARSIFVRKYLLTPGLRLAVVLLLVLLGQDVTFLAVGYVAAGVVGMAVYAVLLVRVMRERGLLHQMSIRRIVVPFRTVSAFSTAMLSTELVNLSMNTGSVVVLAAFHGAAEVAGYRAVFPAARLNQLVFASFLLLYLPLASRFFARADRAGMRQAYWQTALFVAVLTFPVFAMTVPFAEVTTVTLFGERYADSAVVLALLATGYYVNAALGFNSATLQVFGRLRFVVGISASAAVLNLALSLALIPPFGMVGVAVANCATLLAQNASYQWGLRSTLGTSWLDRGYVRPYALVLLAAAALLLVRALVTPSVVVAIGCAVVASVAVVLSTRRWLQLASFFPELRRVPLLRRLVA
jgi:O-antigen/teichoic acid export membrane protein